MISETRLEKVFNVVNVFMMALFTLIVITPLVYIVMNSFVSLEESLRNPYLIIPSEFDIMAYKIIFTSSNDIINGYKITLFRVIVGTSLNLIFTYFISYTLSKSDLPGIKLLTTFIFIPMVFYGGIIPNYIIVKSTGLSNSIWVYIVPTLVSVFNILLLRNFILEIPASLLESAEIDGASETVKLFYIVVPLSLPALATIGLYYAVAQWNNWFDAFLYISDSEKFPIQLVLRNILYSGQVTFTSNQGSALAEMQKHRPPARTLQNAAVVVTTVPIVLVYPFLQKYFIKGLTAGAVKG